MDLGDLRRVLDMRRDDPAGSATKLAALENRQGGFVLAVAHDISRGMAYLHGKGLIHRDLKPQNVLLASESGKGVAKVTDFGLTVQSASANIGSSLKSATGGSGGGGGGGGRGGATGGGGGGGVGEDDGGSETSANGGSGWGLPSLCEMSMHTFSEDDASLRAGASGHNRTGWADATKQGQGPQYAHHTGGSGTFRYMAPEVIVHEPYSASCDVFSYGVVVWEILSHGTPFKAGQGRARVLECTHMSSPVSEVAVSLNPRLFKSTNIHL
jgi:serine/threonine protein kinase